MINPRQGKMGGKMIGIILFFIVVFIWDSIKKSLRVPEIPKVSMRARNFIKAKCGCLTEGGKILKPCEAHRLMVNL